MNTITRFVSTHDILVFSILKFVNTLGVSGMFLGLGSSIEREPRKRCSQRQESQRSQICSTKTWLNHKTRDPSGSVETFIAALVKVLSIYTGKFLGRCYRTVPLLYPSTLS